MKKFSRIRMSNAFRATQQLFPTSGRDIFEDPLQSQRQQYEISISNHQYCLRRGKYTKQIREELDPRDREFIFPFQANFDVSKYLREKRFPTQQINSKNKKQKQSEEYLKLRRKVFDYVSEVCQNVNSIAFRLLLRGELSDGETKAFAAKTVLANIQSVLTDINKKLQQFFQRSGMVQYENEFDNFMQNLTQSIDNVLSQSLSQLASHYPQAPAAGTTARMKDAIFKVNRGQNQQNNLIFSSDIRIEKYIKQNKETKEILNEPEDYTGFVMEVINKAIQAARTTDCQGSTYFQKFQQFNQRLFALADNDYKSLSQKDKSKLEKIQSLQITKIFQSIFLSKKAKKQAQTQKSQQIKDLLQFQQRVVDQYKKNHKILVAQKIPNHVQPFSHADMKQANFKVNHSSVLRIMTKWVESLQTIFEKPQQEISQKLDGFKEWNNNLIEYQINIQKLMENLRIEHENVKVQMNKIKEENKLFQNYFLSQRQSEYSYLKRFTNVREASAQMNTITIEFTKRYLCILIHYLIKAGYQNQQTHTYNVNLVTFRVGDLLRSKLQSSERSFINVMNTLSLLDSSKEMQGKFKLVRIKNKLNMRDNNVLINYMFMGKVQCELQLSVQKMADKDKHYYEFCHFLYQLTRGKFGVLTECASVVCQQDPIISSSTGQYYRPKCYELLESKRKSHKINDKDKDIYKCINCGQLKLRENTSLFQEQTQCNQCIVKQQGAEQQLKDKNEYLSKQKRIKNYKQIQDGDFIILVNNKKIGARFKLYNALKPEDEMRLFLIEINNNVLKEFQNQDFDFSPNVDYFDILPKKKKKQNLKELTYNLGKQITVQTLELIGIDKNLFQKIGPFYQANKEYRMQKNLINAVKFKSEFIDVTGNQWKWQIVDKILKAYTYDNTDQLLYRKYKELDWSFIKSINLVYNNIENVQEILDLAVNCTCLYLIQNKISQINIQKLVRLEWLYLNSNRFQSINIENSRDLRILNVSENNLQQIDIHFNNILTELYLKSNKLQKIDLNPNHKLQKINLSQNQLQQIDLKSNKKLCYLSLQQNKLQQIDLKFNKQLQKLFLSNNKLQNIDLQANPKLQELCLDQNKLQSAKFWISQLTQTENLLDNQQSNECKVTLLYRKRNSQKCAKFIQELNQRYQIGSDYNKHNCKYSFEGQERN